MTESIPQPFHNNNASGLPGAGTGATTDTPAMVTSSHNPFLSSTTTTSDPQSPPLGSPEHTLPNPFSPEPHSPHNPQQENAVPPLPPRPDQSSHNAMATTATIPTQGEFGQASPPVSGGERHGEEANEPDVPEVANLKAMFPDFDSGVLLSVLQSVNRDQDRAIDVLLGMSDPSYVSAQTPSPSTRDVSDPASALLLDEQLARQLALEDEDEARRARALHRQGEQPPRASGQTWPRRGAGSQPAPGQVQTQGGQSDFQQDLQKTVNQLAESGKRTFSSIVSKVKAKINEMDQTRNTSNQSYSSAQPHSYEQQYNQNYSNAAPVNRHAASEAFANEYYSHPGAPPAAAPPVAGGWTSPSQAPHEVEIRGYDVGDLTSHPTSAQPVSVPPPSVVPAGAGIASSPGSDVPRPPPTGSGSPINAAKLGILPKRPVSLLGSQPPSTQGPPSPPSPRRDTQDDDLDYMENPFEDKRK
ncbi:hypothetical protein BXZ70DRAFT_912606 [Cristinia sonorae]|uniref:CUE domain-containing protein n=1 Tax=Cristinia sonorae TaxID=1940300 RepID=A0A8K0UZQ9_9AGAR|nr:hypothetical protein BXZ70DRAFT_912606 [Cristinia sonorae]